MNKIDITEAMTAKKSILEKLPDREQVLERLSQLARERAALRALLKVLDNQPNRGRRTTNQPTKKPGKSVK